MKTTFLQCLLAPLVLVATIVSGKAQENANIAILSGQQSEQSDWIRVGKSRYDWVWLASRFDANGDAKVLPSEIPLEAEIFNRIDRNWDGVLTDIDFDWSKDGQLGKQKETTFALFKLADVDSNGRLSSEEWNGLFTTYSEGSEYLDEEALEVLMFRPRVEKSAREEGLRRGQSEFSPSRLAAANAPLPDQMAPDFELSSPDSSKTVKLSDFRGKKPVVLVFGCYTCGNYRTYSEPLEQMYRNWGKEAEFLRVYVREAHPTDKKQAATSTNKRAGILWEQPTSLEERCDAAVKFATSLNVTTPMVVDAMDNKVGQAYGAWPDRLYIVDREGKIAFAGGPGPFGFNPREMEQALTMLLLEDATLEQR